MAKITSIEDLAKLAGAELGTKKTQSSLELAVEDKPAKKPAKPAKPLTPAKPSKPKKPAKPRKPSKPKKTDTEDRPKYNAFETRTIDLGPYGLQNIDEALNEPNPINHYTRSLKKKDIPGLIKKQADRAQNFADIYTNGVKRGDNSVGYVWVVIGIKRDIMRMEKWLSELEEKA